MPVPGKTRGRLSYTVGDQSGVRVEVLLKGRAFRIVKMPKNSDGNLNEKPSRKHLRFHEAVPRDPSAQLGRRAAVCLGSLQAGVRLEGRVTAPLLVQLDVYDVHMCGTRVWMLIVYSFADSAARL